MRHVFILNSKAGKKKDVDQFCQQIRQAMEGREYEILFTEYGGHAEELARTAAQSGEPVRIYGCGGDGTLNEVVCGAAGYDNAAVTNIPRGTGNDFLKIFGPSYREAFSDLEGLADGPQTAFDLIDCNGKLGLGVVCTGLDARIADDVHRYKRLPLVSGMGAYILSLVENVLFKRISRSATVRVQGETIDDEMTLICICNGRYYGGGFMPVGEAMPDDGILDILYVPKVSLFTLARVIGKYSKGHYRELPQLIRHFHCQKIGFSSDQEMVTVVDGEVMRNHEFTVCLSEKKVNFFYPPYVSYQITPEREAAEVL